MVQPIPCDIATMKQNTNAYFMEYAVHNRFD